MDNYLFECTECARIYSTLGGLHAHAEKHASFKIFGPDTDELMSFTRVLKVTETEEVELDEVEDVPSRNGLIDYMTGIIGLKS